MPVCPSGGGGGLTPPLDPAQNGFVAIALNGDLTYLGGGAGGVLVWDGAAWVSSQIVDANVAVGAAIAGTKITPNFGAQNIITTGTLSAGAGTFTGVTVSTFGAGVVHSSAAGVLSSSLIVDADVAAAAAIAGTKISPNFGSQDVTTTGLLLLGATPRAAIGNVRVPHNFRVAARNQANTDNASIWAYGTTTANTLTFGEPNANVAFMFLSAGTRVAVDCVRLQFRDSVAAPIFGQQTDSAAGVTGDRLTVTAQPVDGSGTIAGGELDVHAGDAGSPATTNATGGKGTYRGGDATGGATASNVGGHVLYRAGRGSGAGAVDANMAFHADPAAWQSGQRIAFEGNATAAPAGAPTAGGFRYVNAGAYIYVGPSGAMTTMGVA